MLCDVLPRYHLTKVALERKECLMGELEDEREKLIAKVREKEGKRKRSVGEERMKGRLWKWERKEEGDGGRGSKRGRREGRS